MLQAPSDGYTAAMTRGRFTIRRQLGGAFAPLILLLTLLFDAPARAALGDDVATVAADQARLHANLIVSHRGSYAIHELAMPTGVRLRHFVGSSGKVFAVSWSGGWRPNLRDVMGTHYDDFMAATRGRPIRRGVARIETRGMVVVMGGPQRAFFGHVYLTDQLPADFLSTSNDLLDGSSD
jgi:hypothetical protein